MPNILNKEDVRPRHPSTGAQNIIIFLLLLLIAGIVGGGFLLIQNLQHGVDEIKMSIKALPSSAPVVMTAPSSSPNAEEIAKNLRKPDTSDFAKGPKDAKISLIEYGDLECPFCSAAHPTLEKILDEYPIQVNLVFRNFPISVHIGAHKKAETALCAAKLGGAAAYYKFIDGIYAKFEADKGPYSTPVDQLPAIAADLTDIPAEDIQKCLDDAENAKSIDQQAKEGARTGVVGTPTFFAVNNSTGEVQIIPGAQSFETFKKTIDAMLAKK